MARLAFVLNIVGGRTGPVAAAFAGGWRAAYAKGVEVVRAQYGVPAVPAPITITSNGGYPFDQNLYQAVKGMVAAEATTIPGGQIIIVAACADGIGGDSFSGLIGDVLPRRVLPTG